MQCQMLRVCGRLHASIPYSFMALAVIYITYLVCCCWAGSRNEIMVFRKLFVENNYKLITVPNPYYTADKKVLVLKCHPFVF